MYRSKSNGFNGTVPCSYGWIAIAHLQRLLDSLKVESLCPFNSVLSAFARSVSCCIVIIKVAGPVPCAVHLIDHQDAEHSVGIPAVTANRLAPRQRLDRVGCHVQTLPFYRHVERVMFTA